MARKSLSLLRSALVDAKAYKDKCAAKAVKFNTRAKMYRVKPAVKKSMKLAKKYEDKVAKCMKLARKYEAKVAKTDKQIDKLKVKIRKAEAARIKHVLESEKRGILALFRRQFDPYSGRQFSKDFEGHPALAVFATMRDLAKSARALNRPSGHGPRNIRDYKWTGDDPTIIPAEAVLLLIPSLAHGPHRDRAKAFAIVRQRLAELRINRDNCADNPAYPGWRKSCGQNGWWLATLSAFVRDILPVLPAMRKALKCRGCEACRAAHV